ncbi:uncharacterized protein MEPE_03641 [Melanopsichium pennsylvanicum]|uniref:Uncharacterized protein n=2 Tax=Melanopsichium pennsylvanicum TaxID=63383 RepID=A0AAJ5C5N7_9BASI|nr:hypothetical protein BN887_04548 [Melanopsichium pennsylvanicum 4]SNX84932.1 uncharacterized protein MEPE_03641 [Melanopsichium pennsylvanicum]
MLSGTLSNFTVLATLMSVLLSYVQASEKFSALVPCSDNDINGGAHHAIVPDARCQLISDTGAFSIRSLDGLSSDRGTLLGFSATSDCERTYTPEYAELVKMMQNESCNAFAIKKEAGKPTESVRNRKQESEMTNNMEVTGKQLQPKDKRSGDEEPEYTQTGADPFITRVQTARKAGNRFIRSTDTKVGSFGSASSKVRSGEETTTTVNDGHTFLKYVIVVEAQ